MLLFPLCAVCIFTHIGPRHRHSCCDDQPLAATLPFFLPLTSTFDNVIGKLLGGADTTEMKSAGLSATISHILAWIPRSVVRVYPSVSPHMGLFLATGNCVVLCFCAGAGVGLSRRASQGEKHSAWCGCAEQNIQHGTQPMTSVCLLQGVGLYQKYLFKAGLHKAGNKRLPALRALLA